MMGECKKISKFSGETKIDESYFKAKRIRSRHGRVAGGKTPVFLLRFARNCKQTRTKANLD